MLCFIDPFHIMDQRKEKEVKLKIGRVYPFSKGNTKKSYHRTLWIICQLLNQLLLWNVKKKKDYLIFFFFIKLIYVYSIFPSFRILFNINLGIHQKNQIHEIKELENRKTCLSLISD